MIIELASQVPKKPAWMIKEELGVERSVRRIQEVINQNLGRRPSRQAIRHHDIFRDRIVAAMEAGGLSRYYCSSCQRRSIEPLFIHQLQRDDQIGSLVFVCRHCSGPGDR
ncbi:hypothetical protein KRR55_06250 [Paeniglutamicibacter sp. ABSL32-1]|uniref:hypothetical protein n=1 Tax=Paeniglutamicibacter quisquiliarum TaxID=2849498 RepID=UPI001C2D5D6A|nr:hypothetical protein [Paeniglutamicibacter quisquiliarum]MBV1778713.1 hypothetical protein [Paeniglutamicibacter quisquiliarum]